MITCPCDSITVEHLNGGKGVDLVRWKPWGQEHVQHTHAKQDHVQHTHAKQTHVQQTVHVPPKKKQKKKATVCEAEMHFPRSQTIPMSQIVTEPAPRYGRLKCLLGEKQKHGGD